MRWDEYEDEPDQKQALIAELTDAERQIEEAARLLIDKDHELARLREENHAKDISVLNLAAEVDRLREENKKLKSWFRESEGHRDYWRWREGKRTSAKDAEIARLREDRNRLAVLVADVMEGYEAPIEAPPFDWEEWYDRARNALKETD